MPITERDLESPDPLRLDREIAALAGACRRSGRLLRRGKGEDQDPFLGRRLIAGQSALRAVSNLPPSDPLREPLRRFVYRLAEERIQWNAIGTAASERYLVERRVEEPAHERLPLAAILKRALDERPRRAAWLRSFHRHAESLGAAEALVWERRQEIALRLGESSPDAIELPFAGIAEVARRFLAASADPFREIQRVTLPELLDVALAANASEGWPRHLVPRTLLDPFRETDLFRSLDLDPGELPAVLAPASFVRAFLRLGAAWVDATAPADQPFVVAHDPYGLRRRTFGALLGALPRTRTFALRALGLDASKIPGHVRALGGAALLAARVAALRVVLRAPALAGRQALGEAFEAGTHDALGVALPRTSAGALVRLHPDDGQRFAGLLLAAKEAARLRESHDEDWYRNPRAVEELRDAARLSPEPHTDEPSLEAGARELLAALGAALT